MLLLNRSPYIEQREDSGKIISRGLCQIVPLDTFMSSGMYAESPANPPKKIRLLFSHLTGDAESEKLVCGRLKEAYPFKSSKQIKLNGGYKADVLFHRSGHLCIVIQVKCPTFDDGHLELLDQASACCAQIIREHPRISLQNVIITNGCSFRFGNLARKKLSDFSPCFVDEIFTLYDQETGELNMRGLSYLHAFMKPKKLPLLDLKLAAAIGSQEVKVNIGDLIGIGGSACVYDCDLLPAKKWQHIKAVVKFVEDVNLARFEEAAYRKLDSLNATPKYYGSIQRSGLLISKCTPVFNSLGQDTKIKSLSGKHFIDLLDALIKMHKHGIVHRDVRLQNIVLDNGRALLTDLGSATEINTVSGYAGTRETASQRILESKIRDRSAPIQALASDDFESLFKTFLMWILPGMLRAAHDCTTYQDIHDFWVPYMKLFECNRSIKDWAKYLRRTFTSQID